jgi:hypothetical protein
MKTNFDTHKHWQEKLIILMKKTLGGVHLVLKENNT